TCNTRLQYSNFLFLLNCFVAKHMTLEDNIKELGRTMVGIGEPRSGNSGDLDFFSVDQAKAVISYLKISLLQHYKLYEYLFHSPREELVIGDENVIELVKSADTSFPAPLEEGLPYNIYSSFIAMPPAAEVETEEIDQEYYPEEPQPEEEFLKVDPLTGFTTEDVKSVLGQITNEVIGNLQVLVVQIYSVILTLANWLTPTLMTVNCTYTIWAKEPIHML
uniref:Ciliary associated calcium binding coiled-coil 1 n=1 Tax=Crocodylus porosus TaxID=8502 RepID=A0A7M4ETV8_CROPO